MMPIPKVAISKIELSQDEVALLKRLLQSHSYTPALAIYVGEIINKIGDSLTIELDGMCLAVLNTTINSIIEDTSMRPPDIVMLNDISYKVQQQLVARMKEILAQAPLRP
ncbi:MAG TPA: hypothetical protein VKY19_29785 [Ktedonosporobacter sp.]|jgi:hypothetical protein|nr:hypothetical protein [Ktedonosporobacter sp.]